MIDIYRDVRRPSEADASRLAWVTYANKLEAENKALRELLPFANSIQAQRNKIIELTDELEASINLGSAALKASKELTDENEALRGDNSILQLRLNAKHFTTGEVGEIEVLREAENKALREEAQYTEAVVADMLAHKNLAKLPEKGDE